MKRISRKLKWSTTISAALLLVADLMGCIDLDWIHLAFLIAAVIPWYLHAVRSIKVGGNEVVFSEQDTTDELPPGATPRTAADAIQVDPLGDPNARRILATLWRYQQQYFPDDDTKRWTFAVHPLAPAYPDYLSGLNVLLRRGFAVVSPENHHCMLSNEGLAFCRHNVATLGDDIYPF